MNDPVLGFFHRWIIEFSKHCEQILIICLYEGQYNLPKNVTVYSLGKERGTSRLEYIMNFYRIIWRERENYDSVFVHMNQIYVLLGGIVWKILRKPVGLWYVHRARTLSLLLAEKLTSVIFTSSSKGITFLSKKSIYLGHGVDIEAGICPLEYKEKRDNHSLLCVGRITPIKDQATIIRACGILFRDKIEFTCTFVGAPAVSGDNAYSENLHHLVISEGVEGKVFFAGNLKQENLFPYYWKSGIHINACPTGGLDKAVIEAMLGGAIPVVSNQAFRDTFGVYANRLIFREGDPKDLAERIKDLLGADDCGKIRISLENKVRETFDLTVLIKKIINWYETSR